MEEAIKQLLGAVEGMCYADWKKASELIEKRYAARMNGITLSKEDIERAANSGLSRWCSDKL